MIYDLDLCYYVCCFFFFKQKTAYEIRPRDWSSDVCSSDLEVPVSVAREVDRVVASPAGMAVPHAWREAKREWMQVRTVRVDDHQVRAAGDRKSVVEGKSVDLG